MNSTYFYIDIIRESSVSKSDMSCAFLHFVFDSVLHIMNRSRVFYSFDKRSRNGAFWRVSVVLCNDFVECAFFVSSIFLLFLDMNSINWSLKRASFYLYSHFYLVGSANTGFYLEDLDNILDCYERVDNTNNIKQNNISNDIKLKCKRKEDIIDFIQVENTDEFKNKCYSLWKIPQDSWYFFYGNNSLTINFIDRRGYFQELHCDGHTGVLIKYGEFVDVFFLYSLADFKKNFEIIQNDFD